ncbi:MAG: metallophosphoesterase, partial [Candidatus Limnocylindrales bacterium]
SPASSNPAASAPDASGAATPAGPVGSPLPSGDPVLVGAGDIGRCDGTADEDTAALVDGTPGIVFTLGDNAYEQGTDQQFRDCFGLSWGRFKDRIMLPVPGNHDHETDNAAGYRAYFGDAATPAGTTWYSRDIGAWHVIVLDSTCSRVDGGCGTDSPQGNWLRADLASSTARCTLALFHHPRFSSGEHGSDPSVAPFWDALYAAGADLVLNGHDHDYERFGPQDPQGRPDQARGIVEIVAGTGGADLRPFGASTPSGIARSSIAHGVLVLTLQPSGWAYRFVSTDGSFSDQGTGTCH